LGGRHCWLVVGGESCLSTEFWETAFIRSRSEQGLQRDIVKFVRRREIFVIFLDDQDNSDDECDGCEFCFRAKLSN
jgi:hypothetical protein